MRTLNLGILAHVDAGKTTLTERLLYETHVIDAIGSVDDGTTQTDTLDLERRRGITIKAAVVSFVVDDVIVNLIDTPGHPDFIAEVERVLNVLDGAVLVISAVEGVQAQTRVLFRTLQRLRIPTLLFVNKIDRRGADTERVMRAVAEKLTPAIVAMGAVRACGTRAAEFVPHDGTEATFTACLCELLADYDDGVLAAYVDDGAPAQYARLRDTLAVHTRCASVHPMFFGSAITGAGVDALIAAIAELLPATHGDAQAPLSGTVFKVDRGPAGEKIAYARLFAGSARIRDRLRVGTERQHTVTAIQVFEAGSTVSRSSVAAGRIAKLWGLVDARIGDTIGAPHTIGEQHHFAPPTLETVIVPRHRSDKGALQAALAQLAEQDPLINLRQDDTRQELYVSLYGEVQKEIIRDTLSDAFGIAVEFRETTTICIERPIGTGAAVEVMREAPNPFLATVGLRVDPAPVGSGVRFALEVELGSIRLAFHKAVEDTVAKTLQQGLYGWSVTDCVVTMTHSGYSSRGSHAHARFDKSMSSTGADFRHLTPLVLMAALKRAGTQVCEPVQQFRIEVPADALSAVSRALSRLDAIPLSTHTNDSTCTIEGEIPAARVHAIQQLLPSLSRGEGLFECSFAGYRPVRGTPPTRSRTDHDPLDRKAYLLYVMRRVKTAGSGTDDE
jgi:ribosomal protection tetracycline resistance protein